MPQTRKIAEFDRIRAYYCGVERAAKVEELQEIDESSIIVVFMSSQLEKCFE